MTCAPGAGLRLKPGDEAAETLHSGADGGTAVESGRDAVEHLVTFRTAEGREGQHTAAALDEALKFVERLRNLEGANEVRVFRMQEIPIEFKTYFKVELRPGEEVGEPGAEPVVGADALRPPLPAPAAHAPAAEPEPESASRRLFSRS